MTEEEIEKKACCAYPDKEYWLERKGYIKALTDQQSHEIEKTVTVSPGMLSTFGPSRYILDVELTQEEQARLGFISGFPTNTIQIKIVCE